MTEHRTKYPAGMPYLGVKGVDPMPWLVLEPHANQAKANHGQSLCRLAERGGLSPTEMLCILEDRKWPLFADPDAIKKLADILEAFAKPREGDTYDMPKDGWVCFHCGERFKTFGAARDHFGVDEMDLPGCVLKVLPGEERGLLMELRKAQETIRQLRSELY